MKIAGFAKFVGLGKEVTSEGRLVKLDLLTPLEPPFTVKCTCDVKDSELWARLEVGNSIRFCGELKMVDTAYFTPQLPLGGKEKRIQTVAIMVSSVTPEAHPQMISSHIDRRVKRKQIRV